MGVSPAGVAITSHIGQGRRDTRTALFMVAGGAYAGFVSRYHMAGGRGGIQGLTLLAMNIPQDHLIIRVLMDRHILM